MVLVKDKALIRDIESAFKYYPLLNIVQNESSVKVVGDIQLFDSCQKELDRYSVSISFPNSYPKRFPKVIEISNKIPRIADRHINYDNSLCLAVLPEELKIARNGIAFKYFLDKILVPHLGRETYYSIKEEYPEGEYGHGTEGIWQYFEDILGKKSKSTLIYELKEIVYSKWLGRNEFCICGSGKKFKKCHLKIWNDILNVGRQNLIHIIQELEKEIQKN